MFAKLQFRQPGIKAAGAEQLIMIALINDPALRHDDNPVYFLYRRQTVRNDQRGPVPHQMFQRFLHQLFAFRIERTGGS